MMKRLKYVLYDFLRGLIVAGPFFLTIYIIVLLFNWIDHLIPIEEIFPKTISRIPGIGIISIFIFFVIIGYCCRFIAFANLFKNIGGQFLKVPFLKFLFSSINDVFNAFNKKESKLNRPILVKMTDMGVYKIGFLVQDDLSILGLDDYVSVYFPHSFAFSGNTMIIHKSQIKQNLSEEVSSSEVLKFIVSGGISKLHKMGEKHHV